MLIRALFAAIAFSFCFPTQAGLSGFLRVLSLFRVNVANTLMAERTAFPSLALALLEEEALLAFSRVSIVTTAAVVTTAEPLVEKSTLRSSLARAILECVANPLSCCRREVVALPLGHLLRIDPRVHEFACRTPLAHPTAFKLKARADVATSPKPLGAVDGPYLYVVTIPLQLSGREGLLVRLFAGKPDEAKPSRLLEFLIVENSSLFNRPKSGCEDT
mmetsp:Transcript_16131/g.39734  ORF Transcript_16131/g.39734 Transcript_16131/m.39734 type:complete len:218 (-) Transcript_16131:65-718(-)